MNAEQKRLAQAIRTASQPQPPTKAQKQFERFLKCKRQHKPVAILTAALNVERQRHSNAEPLIPPTAALPPMF